MTPAWPRYLLFVEPLGPESAPEGWRFMLHAVDTDHSIVASDAEPGMPGERLALMAVVRGLEALEQPSAVKLVCSHGSIRRGVTRGIHEWRANNWKWERFGRLTPVRDEDLWRRIDTAANYHRVSCRGWMPAGESSATSNSKPTAWRAGELRTRPPTNQRPAADRVISEPALLIVRGRRRRVVTTVEPTPSPDRLAIAG